MVSLLEVLQSFNLGARPPATEEQLRHLEETLGCALPVPLAALYRAFDGQDATQTALVFRLLRLDEVHALIQDGEWLELPPAGRAFFADDHGNYAFVYLTGPLQGKVGLNDHDDPSGEPVFRSVPSFLMHLMASGNRRMAWEFRGMSRDYPARLDRHAPSELASDRALSAHYRRVWAESADPDERLFAVRTAITLLPHQDSNQILPFVREAEPGVAGFACAELGLREWAPAIPTLHQVALDGPADARAPATMALGLIPVPEAAHALVDVLQRCTPAPLAPLTWVAAVALQEHAYTVVVETDGTGRVRERHDTPWIPFPYLPAG
ncbi:SMI1/KNR4 family protein [Deinococcus enclensis]|uniref:Knr4/Smi1-like domain-containing protein n=1 Tax=Deinococcus enclensis TaxID=1049582 RepID=A0ABT9MFI8_9DEIO|nr:SMI1/KNR4 family protein [Deinococcus enclensis]MDP9765363.1 hypothetical protein [Deinococcus enclensis]